MRRMRYDRMRHVPTSPFTVRAYHDAHALLRHRTPIFLSFVLSISHILCTAVCALTLL